MAVLGASTSVGHITTGKTFSLSSDSQVFTYDTNGTASPASQLITITEKADNLNSASSVTYTTNPTVTLGSVAGGKTLSIADFGSNSSVTITAVSNDGTASTTDDLTDSITIHKLVDGHSAYTVFQTNESHTVAAGSDGTVTVFAGSETELSAYYGSTKILVQAIGNLALSPNQFRIRLAAQSSTITKNDLGQIITPSRSAFGAILLDNSVNSIFELNQDAGSRTFEVEVAGPTGTTPEKFDLIQSFSKSKAGLDPFTGFLTNESETVSSDEFGNAGVFSIGGTFKVFEGTAEISTLGDVTYAVVADGSVGGETINSSTGVYSVTSITDTTSSTGGSVVFTATVGGEVIASKLFTVAKSVAGINGSRTLKLTTDRQTFEFANSNPSTQAAGVATLSTSLFNFTDNGSITSWTAKSFTSSGAELDISLLTAKFEPLTPTSPFAVLKATAFGTGSDDIVRVVITASKDTPSQTVSGATDTLIDTMTIYKVREGDSVNVSKSGNTTTVNSSDGSSIAIADGATWHTGTGEPDDSLGNDGDYYLRVDDEAVYQKVLGSWGILIDTISGANANVLNFIFIDALTEPVSPSDSAGIPIGWTDSAPEEVVNILWTTLGTQVAGLGDFSWDKVIRLTGIQGVQGVRGATRYFKSFSVNEAPEVGSSLFNVNATGAIVDIVGPGTTPIKGDSVTLTYTDSSAPATDLSLPIVAGSHETLTVTSTQGFSDKGRVTINGTDLFVYFARTSTTLVGEFQTLSDLSTGSSIVSDSNIITRNAIHDGTGVADNDWSTFALEVDGSLLVKGTVVSDAIATGAVSASKISVDGSINITSDTGSISGGLSDTSWNNTNNVSTIGDLLSDNSNDGATSLNAVGDGFFIGNTPQGGRMFVGKADEGEDASYIKWNGDRLFINNASMVDAAGIPITSGSGTSSSSVLLYTRVADGTAAPTAVPTVDAYFEFFSGRWFNAANGGIPVTSFGNNWEPTIPSGLGDLYVVSASASSKNTRVLVEDTDWSPIQQLSHNGIDADELTLTSSTTDGVTTLLFSDGTSATIDDGADGAIARGPGFDAVPAYSNDDPDTITFDESEAALVLQSDTDDTTGMAYPAFNVEEGKITQFSISYKSSTASSDGFYVRVYEFDSDLPSGKLAISNDATNSVVQEDTRKGIIFPTKENVGITTSYQTQNFTYTPTSTAKWASIVILNWTGMGNTSLFIKPTNVTMDGISSGVKVVYADTPSGNGASFTQGTRRYVNYYEWTGSAPETVPPGLVYTLFIGEDGDTSGVIPVYADDTIGTNASLSDNGQDYINFYEWQVTPPTAVPPELTYVKFVGSQGPAVVLTSNTQPNFISTDSNLNSGQSDIVFTATVVGVDSPTFVWTQVGCQTAPTASTSSTYTVKPSQFGNSQSVKVTCTVSGIHTADANILRLDSSTAAANATVGADFDSNITGKINSVNVTSLIDNGAINSLQIGSLALTGVGNFSVKSSATGERMEIDSETLSVFDGSGIRVKLGRLT